MNLAKQLEEAGLTLKEVDLLINTLEVSREAINSGIKKLQAYKALEDAYKTLADTTEGLYKTTPEIYWGGKTITLAELQEHDASFLVILEKLKLIKEI